jgi:hypothetical protein
MRSRTIKAHVTPEDYEIIEAYAEATDRTVASLVRHTVMAHIRRDSKLLAKLLDEAENVAGRAVAGSRIANLKGGES